MTAKEIIIKIITITSVAWMSCNNNQSTTNTNTATSVTDATVTTTNDTVANKQNNNDSTVINADWLLIPGIAAGQTKLNDNADSVYQRLGTPDGGDAAMMKAIAIWYSNHDTTDNSIAVYTSKNTDSPVIARIQQIRVTSPVFKTAAGIHTGSSLQDIRAHFPVQKTEVYKDAGTSYAVYDSKEGIAFEMNPDSVCVAIIIHKAGVINEGTYLKFRTTNRFINRKKQ